MKHSLKIVKLRTGCVVFMTIQLFYHVKNCILHFFLHQKMKSMKKKIVNGTEDESTAVNSGPEADLDFFRRILDTIPPSSFFSDDAKGKLLQESDESSSESDEIDGNICSGFCHVPSVCFKQLGTITLCNLRSHLVVKRQSGSTNYQPNGGL